MKSKNETISRIKNISIALFIWVAAVSLVAFSVPWSANAQSAAPSDLAFDMEDMNFMLDQIKIAERHAAGEELADILPNLSIPWGLRTVDGSFNNLIPGQEDFGAADQEFDLAADRVFPNAQDGTTYNSADTVMDSTPRLISHLVTNQSVMNPAAVATAAAEGGVEIGPDIGGANQFLIPNTAPDEGLSAPFNAYMTFFGQFFDHGLDLINKGGNGTVFMPLQQDDPLFDPGPDLDPDTLGDNGPNFMAMTRATRGAGLDTILGNEDDTFLNATTPHVDQQQTYASHASSQILLRHYEFGPCPLVGAPLTPPGPLGTCLQNTGRLLNGYGTDRILDTPDDGGMATWDTAQAQAALKFGIDLDDLDGNNVPLILSDVYGNFIPGPARGLPQLVTGLDPLVTMEGNLVSLVDASLAMRVNQSFFLDVAHSANPNAGGGVGPQTPPAPDANTIINPRIDTLSGQETRGIRESAPTGFYDDELLGAHFVCGDGRCNENIALSTVHTIFHHEHNRLASVAKRILLDNGDLAILNEWLDSPLMAFPAWGVLPFPVSDASLANQATAETVIDALNLDWNGGRIFQAARFGTEMQYNRIVFDEFAPTLAGLKDAFVAFHTNVNPTITAEFSQSVYRFGHSMLTSTVDRLSSDFAPITDSASVNPLTASNQLGLFEAFLNPLALYNSDEDGIAMLTPEQGTGAVIRGLTRTTANEIDEFVTGALQNNLVGLPLDLGAINIARGRDVGNPPLNAARRMFYAETQDTRLMPYANWADYADNLRHEASLVNFIAAYGKHPTLAGADGIVGNADDASGPDGIVGNADDMDTSFTGRRAAACAIVGALTAPLTGGPDGIFGDDPLTLLVDESLDDGTPDVEAYCLANGYGTPPATPADAGDFLFGMNAWANDINGHTITGLDDVDFWNGGLAEERMPFGGYLGSTHNYIFETQIEHLQNGDRFYYLGRTANIHMLTELESNSFTALVLRSTDVNGGLPLNIFSVPNHILEVDQTQQFDAAGDGTTADPEGDADLTPLVIRDADQLSTNILVLDTTRVLQYTGGDHVTIGGTDGSDTIIGGIGDDSILGGLGDDRLEGGDGADHIEGGPGDDIITDLSGPDVIEAGAGNDAVNSGNSEDIIFGDEGNDFLVNPSEFGEIFGGLGNDFIFDGEHNGHIRGGAGNDWMENLGGGEDLFQGDNGAAPEGGEPVIKGHDVLVVHGGNTDGDMENGDDIVVDGPGIDRAEGQLGFDWMSFGNDRFGVDIDLDLTVFLRPTFPPSNNTILNRYDRIEGISGSPLADVLRGTDNPAGESNGNELVNFGLIDGLGDLVPADERSDLPPDPVTGDAQFGWSGGEIILGGAGSDVMEGKGGDDIIDGDRSLKVGILTPNPVIRSGPLGQALLAAKVEANSTASQAALDVIAAGAFSDLKTAAMDAVTAADAAVTTAELAVKAKDAAQAGLSEISVTDALGALITNAALGYSVDTEWKTFLASCSAALADLGWDVGATDANTLAEALAEQAAAVLDQANLTQAALDDAVLASEALMGPAQDALKLAQADLDAAEATPGPDGILGDDLTTTGVDESLDDGMIIVAGMQDVMAAIFGGFINPGELSISRVISDDDLTGKADPNHDTDTAVFSANRNNYTIVRDNANNADNPLRVEGFVVVIDNRVGLNDGRDLIVQRSIERLQFANRTVLIGNQVNSLPQGDPTIMGVAEVPNELTASSVGVTDADNVLTAGVVDPAGIAWTWLVEQAPGSGIFEPILRVGGLNGNGDAVMVTGETMTLTAEEANLRIQVTGRFQDEALVLETIRSAPVTVSPDPGALPPPVTPGATLTINSVEWRGGRDRLRVRGDVAPVGTVTIFAPGVRDGTICTGTPVGTEVAAADGGFDFDTGNGGVVTDNPGSVCVQSDDLAVGART